MSRSTRFLARLIGLFTIVLVAAILVRGSAIVETMVGDRSIMFVLAMISVAAGLAMVLAHNVWSGGVLPVAVTLVGWWMLAKGLLLLFLTPGMLARLFEQMHYGEHLYLILAPSFVIGIYFIWAGFAAPPPDAHPQA
jgi:hypothetical protein